MVLQEVVKGKSIATTATAQLTSAEVNQQLQHKLVHVLEEKKYHQKNISLPPALAELVVQHQDAS